MGVIENLKAKRDELVAGGVAVSAFAASAQHIFHVTQAAGNPDVVAALHPAGIDGLIYIGIRAMQHGNKKAGGFAVAYGAAYSLAFNAASYGGFVMPVWALAACMPLAMFFAFLIVHGGHKVVPVTETVERIVEVVKAPALLPIIPFQPTVAPVRIPSLPKAVAASRTRSASWDVEKVVALILDGKEDAEITSAVELGAKTLQRTRRVVKLLQADMTPEDIKAEINPPMSLAHITRIRAAMSDMS